MPQSQNSTEAEILTLEQPVRKLEQSNSHFEQLVFHRGSEMTSIKKAILCRLTVASY